MCVCVRARGWQRPSQQEGRDAAGQRSTDEGLAKPGVGVARDGSSCRWALDASLLLHGLAPEGKLNL